MLTKNNVPEDIWKKHVDLVSFVKVVEVDSKPEEFILETQDKTDAVLRADLENDVGSNTEVVFHGEHYYVRMK